MKNKLISYLKLSLICLIFISIPLLITACNNTNKLYSQDAIEYKSSEAMEHKDKSDKQLEVEFIDVGQGDSVLISCNNHHMLIDGGNSSKSSTIYSVLEKKNITYLDYIIITHTDADHCGGIAGALNKAKVGTCYCSKKTDNSKTWDNIIKYLNQQEKDITIPKVNDKISLDDAVITFLAPYSATHEDNNNSVVCRLDYGITSFMFTGDAETEEEQELFSSKVNLKADVLKVSHHGSNKCSSDKFINEIQPKYAIISVGKNNYGHPGKDTIQRLKSHKAQVYRTDQAGDIVITSNGEELKINCSKGA